MTYVRKGIRFFGRVQGVGFRWRAKTLATEFGITGFAFNQSDGSVVAEFQGDEAKVDRLLMELDHDHFIRIERIEARSMEIKEGETGFKVW